MEIYEQKPIDATIIKMMYSLRDKHIKNNQECSHYCLLLEEKIIYTSIAYLHTNNQEEKISNAIPQIQQLIVSFAQKVNKLAMENYEQQVENQSKLHEKYINKAIALLMLPETKKHLKDVSLLKKLKILSFNNLSCIFKKKKKFGVALRAINYAVELQEQLLTTEGNPEKYDIVPTYLNKAAIYSEMKKHSQSLQIILKAKSHIQEIQKQLTVQIQKTNEESEKKRLLEKRYYGMYMKMIIFYNLAAEKEHLRLKYQALELYKQSKQIAIIISNQLMINKLTNIIQNLLGEKE